MKFLIGGDIIQASTLKTWELLLVVRSYLKLSGITLEK